VQEISSAFIALNKARQPANLGATGLGLAIVKHIAQLLRWSGED